MDESNGSRAVSSRPHSAHEGSIAASGQTNPEETDSRADGDDVVAEHKVQAIDIDPPPKELWRSGGMRWNRIESGKRRVHDINYCARSSIKLYTFKGPPGTEPTAPLPRRSVGFRYLVTMGVKLGELEAQPDGSPIFEEVQATTQIIHQHWRWFWLPEPGLNMDIPYVVLGIMRKNQACSEVMVRVLEPESLFKQMRKASSHLRWFPVRVLSLKRVVGFSLYECDPENGSHRSVEITPNTQRALRELWTAYKSRRRDYNERWLNWIHVNLNNESYLTHKAQLTLKLELEWSPIRLAVWGLTPFFLSLAIGFWYSSTDHGGADRVTIVQTGWTIASYIVSGGALILAVLAAITQLGHP